MVLYHVSITRTMIGFIEVRAESKEEAKQVAEEVVYIGKEDPCVHWDGSWESVGEAEPFPEAWTDGMEFLEVKKDGSAENGQGD